METIMNIKKSSLAAVLSLMIVPGLSAAQEGEWIVAPYIWATDVSWDLAERGAGGVSFSNIVDKLDGAGLIRIEYARNKIGFKLDYIGMSLSDGTRISTPGPIPVDIGIRADMDLTVLEVGVFYRPSAIDSGFDFLFGIREVDNDATLMVTPTNSPTQRIDSNAGFTDVFLGARYLHRLTDRWDFSVRGDYGFGDSDGMLNLAAGVGWRTAGTFGMHLAYRHMAVEFDHRVDGAPVTSELDMSGPMLGLLFRF
jgi:hypothetical protein